MNRQPVYHEINPEFRVVSRWNNRWVAQQLSGSLTPATRERDPWVDLHRPTTSKADAIGVMNAKCPDKPKRGQA